MSESAADIAKALGGKRSGRGYICRCPCSNHGKGNGDRNPSLSIADGNERLLVKCFAGCDARDILDALQQQGLLERGQGSAGHQLLLESLEAVAKPDPEAIAIWRSATGIEDTVAERYLSERRGLVPPYPPSLRFMQNAVYKPTRHHMPALVAAVSGPDRRVTAVQLTYLQASDGKKAPVREPRWTYGVLAEGAVRLAAADKILGLAEGVEDGLSAIALAKVPTWACIGAGRMHRVSVPEEVTELHLFVDDDEPGRAAAERTAARHTAEGRRVVLRLPPLGFKDWNDVAMEGALA
jgi:hypothetical protein